MISGLIYARNFYIALLDDESGYLTFPYSMDEVDSNRLPRLHGRGATEYVMRHAKPLLADPDELARLLALGEISHSGARSVCWLGVPLLWSGKAIGVLAVQSYSPEYTYTARDQELLTFVSYHIANALQRKHAASSLKKAYASLERRVTERTRALALANRDLREQAFQHRQGLVILAPIDQGRDAKGVVQMVRGDAVVPHISGQLIQPLRFGLHFVQFRAELIGLNPGGLALLVEFANAVLCTLRILLKLFVR